MARLAGLPYHGVVPVRNLGQPRQNRVSPAGEIVAIRARGRAMGNRGQLTDPGGRVVRPWKLKRWICCTLREVNGRKVRFDDPEGYTPLFFTDEAVALAAGHRPCGKCRPNGYFHWLAIFKKLAGISKFERVSADVMDRELHARRMNWSRSKLKTVRLYEAPEGAFVRLPAASLDPLLVHKGCLWPWSEGCYGNPIEREGHYYESVQLFPQAEFLIGGFRFDDELTPAPQAHSE